MTRDLLCLLVGIIVLAAGASSALAQRSTPVQLLHPSGAAGDNFGRAVAIDGDTLIVGAYLDTVGANASQGSAHIFRWTGSGWAFEATLTASDGAPGDSFGASVALSGDTALVGANLDDVGPNSNQGSAYVFVRSGTTWTQQAKLTASDGADSDDFGYAVALSGETALIGAILDDVGANSDQGSAYIFVRSGTTWTQQAKLTAADGASGDEFGFSVALSGQTALIGSALDDVGANPDQGSAYVFVRSGTSWSQQAKLAAADGAPFDDFGWSVALDGDTALVGAVSDDVGATVNQGSAYVFVRSGTTWSQQAQLTASDGAAGDDFGVSVALAGNTALVGAYLDDLGPNNQQGSAYVFVRSGAAWMQQAQLTAPDGAAGDTFGVSVALSGDAALVGAYLDNVGSNTGQGSAWVFSRVGSKWIGPDLQALAAGGAANDQFGFSVALSGDTALVGAPLRDVGANADQGSAYVFVRAGTTWTQQAQLTAAGGAASDQFGAAVALSGDTALVGAPLDDVGANADQGSAYVFTRSGTTWTQQAQLTATGGSAGDQFGYAVALTGDTAIVGAYLDDVGANTDQGSAYVFTRSGTVWTQQAQLTASDGAAGDNFGFSVAVSGDTALVGAWADDVGANVDQGSAYVFFRSGTTWTQQAKLTASDGAPSDRFGNAVALSGDTALVGAFIDDVGPNTDQGSAYVFVRSGSSWTQQAKLTASDGAPTDKFGNTVALSGDTALVGAYFDDIGPNANQGSAYVFVRSGTTWLQQAQLTAAGGAADDLFGLFVALSGDTALVGAFADDVGANINQGSAYTYDVAFGDFSTVLNNTTGVAYSSLAAAFSPALSGQQITATDAAFHNIGVLDTLGRSLIVSGTGAVRTPSTSVLALGGGSALSAPPGSPIQIFGQLRASAGASVDVYGDNFQLGSRGILTVRSGASLTFDVPQAFLAGQTRTETGAFLTFNGAAEADGPLSAATGTTLTSGGTFTNSDTFSITAGTINAPLFDNRAAANFFGTSVDFGSYTNEGGAVTTIRSGTLYVFGSLTNNGTIIGAICSNCLATPPNLDVGGSLVLGPDANLTMPFSGSLVHIGGNFDCAINSNARYGLSLATVQMEATAGPQTLEVMSTDIGPLPSGLDHSLAGHYPIGVLHIGPAPSTVQLVDNHDNDNLGQGVCEALYVNQLIIDGGSHLINPSCRIYYSTLVNNGSVDVPANLVRIPHCGSADFNCDGDLGTDADIASFFACLAGTCPPAPCTSTADFNGDGDIGTDADIEAFFRVLAGGSC
jgi:hypothetical protein